MGVGVEGARGGDAGAAVDVGVEEGQDAVYAIDASGGVGLGAAVVGQGEPAALAWVGLASDPAAAVVRHGLLQLPLVDGQGTAQAAWDVVATAALDRRWVVVVGYAGTVVRLHAGAGQHA